MTTVKTLPAANYSEAQVTAIVAAYKAGDSLESIAASIGKSVPSVRAKLAALKVYVSKAKSEAKTSDKETKANKEALASLLSQLVGVDLLNVEAASKVALVALINAIKSRDEKINSLINDMLGDDSSLDDSNDLVGKF
jgi:dsRNA-specific ribonuclease